MSYRLSIEVTPSFLHAIVIGTNSPSTVADYLEQLLAECMARNVRRLLIEERLEGPRLSMMEVFRTAEQGIGPALGKLQAIAYVDIYAEGDLMEFAEDVAVNRGLPVVVFKTVGDARTWLKTLER
jgi:hypothetical protein